jgi:PAS domain S-box-containing protein
MNKSAQWGTAEYKRLSKNELNARLDTLLHTPAPEQSFSEVQLLLHELNVHQIELEIQNRELRESQERLEEARDRYADLYDFAPVGFLTLDTHGNILNLNLTAAVLLGGERARFIGTPFVTQVETGESPVFFRHLHDVFQSKRKIVDELRLKITPQRSRIVLIKSIAIFEDAGNPKSCNCAIIDITGQKEAEQALRAERDRAQGYLDTVEAMIVALDTDGRITLANRKTCEILGYGENELIGNDWFTTCLPPSEESETVRNIFRQLLAGDSHSFEYIEHSVRAHSGAERLIAWHNSVLLDTQKNVVGILSAGEDITQRKQAEEDLRKLHRAVDQSPAIVVITDAEGNTEYVNPAFSKITGFNATEIQGKNPRILQSFVTPDEEYESIWKSITGGMQWFGEYQNRKKNGEYYWESTSISPVRDSNGNISNFLAVKEDITGLKQREEQDRQHAAELAHMARLNIMGEMATGIAHELNQPLSAISTYASVALRLLRSGEDQADNMVEALEGMRDQAIRASEIIRHVRQFVSKHPLRKARIDMNELIGQISKFAQHDIRKQKIKINLHLAKNIPLVEADRIQIEQVLLNILRNSMEAMQSSDKETREITIVTGLSERGLVQTAISDTGPGMDEKILGRIFEPFMTTKEESGMGVGLSICRSIIENHGGRLWAESQPGKGATFFFALPVGSPLGERYAPEGEPTSVSK